MQYVPVTSDKQFTVLNEASCVAVIQQLSNLDINDRVGDAHKEGKFLGTYTVLPERKRISYMSMSAHLS